MHPMTTTGPTRLRSGGTGGVLAGLAFAAGIFLPVLPGGDNGIAPFLQRYADSGTRWTALLAAGLLAAAALLLAWFLAAVLLRAQVLGPATVFSALAGAATVALLLVTAAALAAVPMPLMMNTGAVPDASSAAMGELAMTALVAACLAAGATVVAISATALRTATLPRWVARTGLVVGPLMLLSVVFVPIVLLSVWLVFAGAAMALRRDSALEASPATAVQVTA